MIVEIKKQLRFSFTDEETGIVYETLYAIDDWILYRAKGRKNPPHFYFNMHPYTLVNKSGVYSVETLYSKKPTKSKYAKQLTEAMIRFYEKYNIPLPGLKLSNPAIIENYGIF